MEWFFWGTIGIIIGFIIGQRHGQEQAGRKAKPQTAPAAAMIEPVMTFSEKADSKPVAKVQDKPKTHSPLDQISVLLYLGAFLMISGAGLFVGLSDFNGITKTITVAVVAFIFYLGGLWLYKNMERLKPAALTFTAIGLIALPLAGVAAYSYTEGAASTIWFVTSLVCLVLYMSALYVVRQSFMGYLVIFMSTSLWLSAVAVIDAPVYFFGWGSIILAGLYLLAAKYFKLWHETEQPLSISATIIVPVTLGLMLLFGHDTITLAHKGITLLLTAGYYGLASFIQIKAAAKRASFVASFALIPLGLGFITYDATQDLTPTSVTFAAATTVLLFLLTFVRNIVPATWLTFSANGGVIFLATAVILCASTADWQATTILIAGGLLVSAFMAYEFRNTLHMGFALVCLLALPFVGGVLNLSDTPIIGVIASYLGIALGLTLFAKLLESQVLVYRILAASTYGASLGIACLFGFSETDWVPLATSFATAIVLLVASYYHKKPLLIYTASLLGTVGLLQTLDWNHSLSNPSLTWALGGLGALLFIIGRLHAQLKPIATHKEPWVFCGIALLTIGGIIGVTTTQSFWPGIAVLGAAGLAIAAESYWRKSVPGLYAGAGFVVAALEFAFFELGVREAQLYWYIWAAYAGLIAYRHYIAQGIWLVSLLTVIGALAGLMQHTDFAAPVIAITLATLASLFYILGKLHLLLLSSAKNNRHFATIWSYAGLIGLYMAAVPLDPNNTQINSVVLIAAGGLTAYETFSLKNRLGAYTGGAVAMAGFQWFLYQNQIHDIQVFTHLWALFFGLLALLSFIQKRSEDETTFTVIALGALTIPLALQGLGGNTELGLQLLFEGVGLVILSLWLHRPLVRNWGLVCAIGAVVYQLRAYEFFTLVLLGAGVIGVAVYLLLRKK
ncbi:MAG TPA: hypothetical protein VFT87_03310 [Candidatus Saccharimonadales bacterium]|nr:hypothetical protein [Candidatus Saccharimonadales bacterium]